jgi:hypothetical protein
MLFGNINNIKCAFVHEPAKLLEPFIVAEGVIYFNVKDIAAMKLHTICGRGKKKDFFDVYAMLQLYSRETLIEWFTQKYDHKLTVFFCGAAFCILKMQKMILTLRAIHLSLIVIFVFLNLCSLLT